jgi:hypothetical protein
MKEKFSASQISRVIDQALIYQCACPAQVGRAIFEMRELYAYQMNCANSSENDQRVHGAIALATEKSHEILENCLKEILVIEGWDQESLSMPDTLKKKPAKTI